MWVIEYFTVSLKVVFLYFCLVLFFFSFFFFFRSIVLIRRENTVEFYSVSSFHVALTIFVSAGFWQGNTHGWCVRMVLNHSWMRSLSFWPNYMRELLCYWIHVCFFALSMSMGCANHGFFVWICCSSIQHDVSTRRRKLLHKICETPFLLYYRYDYIIEHYGYYGYYDIESFEIRKKKMNHKNRRKTIDFWCANRNDWDCTLGFQKFIERRKNEINNINDTIKLPLVGYATQNGA